MNFCEINFCEMNFCEIKIVCEMISFVKWYFCEMNFCETIYLWNELLWNDASPVSVPKLREQGILGPDPSYCFSDPF